MVSHVLLTRVVDLCTFSHGSNPNKGGCFSLMWLVALSFQCFNVAVQYFEELFLDIRKGKSS